MCTVTQSAVHVASSMYTLKLRYLDCDDQYQLWDVHTCCIANELVLTHNIHCVQPCDCQLKFDSQRDLDFAILLLSGRQGIELV